MISGPFSWFCFFCAAIVRRELILSFQLNFIQNWYRPYFRRILHIYTYTYYYIFFFILCSSRRFVRNHIRNSIIFLSCYCSKMYDLRFTRPDAMWRWKHNFFLSFFMCCTHSSYIFIKLRSIFCRISNVRVRIRNQVGWRFRAGKRVRKSKKIYMSINEGNGVKSYRPKLRLMQCE